MCGLPYILYSDQQKDTATCLSGEERCAPSAGCGMYAKAGFCGGRRAKNGWPGGGKVPRRQKRQSKGNLCKALTREEHVSGSKNRRRCVLRKADAVRRQKSIKNIKKVLTNPNPLDIILFATDNRRQCPGVAQFGSALEWGSRGREFDSRHSDQIPQPKGWGIFLLFMRVCGYNGTIKGPLFGRGKPPGKGPLLRCIMNT